MKKEYLSEQNYERVNNKFSTVALLVFIMGLVIGGGLIATGLIKNIAIKNQYSETAKQETIEKINSEKVKLQEIKKDLQDKGVEYDGFVDYDDGEAYDLYIVTTVLDPSFDRCSFSEFQNNALTSAYCNLNNKLDDFDNSTARFATSKNIPFFMFGAFIFIASCMIALVLYMNTKRRAMLAYGLQTVMPLAQEGAEKMMPTFEKMAPSIGRIKKTIAKETAPVYGEIAKEISKGIKQGIKEAENENDK